MKGRAGGGDGVKGGKCAVEKRVREVGTIGCVCGPYRGSESLEMGPSNHQGQGWRLTRAE